VPGTTGRSPVAFVLKGYPRLSETFIAQEMRALERRGFDLRIVSLRHPTDPHRHPVHEEMQAPVLYLPEYLYQEPRRVLAGWRWARRQPAYGETLKVWWHDFRRDPTPNRIRRLGQAMVLGRELPDDVVHLHAHFLHTPASVARYTAILKGMAWTCSAHARDICPSPRWELSEKLAHCRWSLTCTQTNTTYLGELAPDPERVELVYHGLDLERFPPPPERPARDGRAAEEPVVLLSVGRAVEKKGYDILLDALARLPDTLHWRFRHVGGGPLLSALQARARRLGLAERIVWLGALPQAEVVREYRGSDLFVLASRTAADGDRDGLPNVLMEAQSQGLACVATDLSAIPEFIRDGSNGLLVPESDATALAAALGRLATDPDLRQRMGAQGYQHVRTSFTLDAGIDRLADKFARTLAESGS